MIKFEANQQAGRKISKADWAKWLKKIQRVLGLKKNLEVSIAVVGKQAMKKHNKFYRGKDKETDVLSFAKKDSKMNFFDPDYLGEIIICYPQAKFQAKNAGHSVNKEIELLLTHGFLHLLGYDHEKKKEAEKMWKLESKIINP